MGEYPQKRNLILNVVDQGDEDLVSAAGLAAKSYQKALQGVILQDCGRILVKADVTNRY